MTGRDASIIPLVRPTWLPKRVWPFETFGLEVDGSTLAVTDVGRGPVLLLVHVGAWSFIWRDLISRLATDFRCICFDAPGNGRTVDGAGISINLDTAARAVRGVIEGLDLDDVTLVAHDLGGIAGLGAFARKPERLRGIVAVNAFAWTPQTPLRIMLAIVGNPLMRELDVLTGIIPRISATSFGVGRNLDEPARQAFLDGMGSRGRRAFHNYLRDARRSDQLYDEIARALSGPLSTLPLLTIFGEHNDPFHFQQQWKALFPECRQVVLANGNHFPMCDDPDLVAQSIRSWHREWVAAANGEQAGKVQAI
ncbi:MAG TPA: alpha/beta fold hydrolase [Thermoanaerobaculia bacterium]|nr:alpha/beta fold hydrolase [Thermoanaerobaculia bacterium]